MFKHPLWLNGAKFALILGLAFMVGGMLALGAFTAPIVFHELPLEDAGRVMTLIFRQYDVVLTVSGVLVLLGQVVIQFLSPKSLRLKLQGALVGLLLGSMAYGLFVVHPKIEAYQKAGIVREEGAEGKSFDALHKQSELLYKTDLGLGVILLGVVLL